MSPFSLGDFECLFTPADLTQITSKVALIADAKAAFLAEDDFGGSYNYGREGFPKRRKYRAEEWLGVEPMPESETDSNIGTINGVPVEEYCREHGIQLSSSIDDPVLREYVCNNDRQTGLPEALRVESSQLIHLPGGDLAWVAKTAPGFPKWRGAPSANTFGNKPILDYCGEAVFAELFTLRILQDDGWNGVWVTAFGKRGYLTAYDPRKCAVLPLEQQNLLTKITGSSAFPRGCWDVFAWRGDEVLFAECKRANEDAIRPSQRRWLEAALAVGVSIDLFLIVEWTLL